MDATKTTMMTMPEATASAIGEGMRIAPDLMAAFLHGLQSGYQLAQLEPAKEAS